VVFPSELRNAIVIANNVKRRWSDKVVTRKKGEWRFTIEWMPSRETNHASIARDPLIRCAHIAKVFGKFKDCLCSIYGGFVGSFALSTFIGG
jgi:hypothetical protein